MPQQTFFLADQKSPTASVLLTLSGAGFDDAAVRGIQRLVANAVSGLTPANVVIADQAGDLLSSSDGGIGDAAASKLATESRYSRQLEAGAQQIVDQMLGPGQGLVSINARLNLDTQTEKQITYGKTGTPLQQSTENENAQGQRERRDRPRRHRRRTSRATPRARRAARQPTTRTRRAT